MCAWGRFDTTQSGGGQLSDFTNIPENRSAQEASLHRVLIVDGGAGGLELATCLGDTLGKQELH
jgi:hypothetical protein